MADLVHRPRVEDLGPGHGEMLVCDADDQEWPCDHEHLLALEPPDYDDPWGGR